MNFATVGELKEVLDDMQQRGVIGSYAVGGAFAATLLNEPIATADLDIFFLYDPAPTGLVLDMSPVYDYAREKGFSFDHEFIEIYGWLVQFIESGTDPLWRNAVVDAQPIRFVGVELPVIRPSYLVAMWLQAGRPKDYDKIRQFAESGLVNVNDLPEIDRYGLTDKWGKVRPRIFYEN